MKRRGYLLREFLLLLSLLLLVGCASLATGDRADEGLSAKSKANPLHSPYFIHVTDMHLHPDESHKSWQLLEKFVEQIQRMKHPPAFVANTGDTLWGQATVTSADALRPGWQRYQRIMSRLGVPLYDVIGNHDLSDSDKPRGGPGWGKELFEEFCGPRYQSFDWESWHIIILDQWLWPPLRADIDTEQFEWLRKDLAARAPGQTVLFLVHYRLPDYRLSGNKLAPILRKDLRYIELAGDDHTNSYWSSGNRHSYVTAAFSGTCILSS